MLLMDWGCEYKVKTQNMLRFWAEFKVKLQHIFTNKINIFSMEIQIQIKYNL